MKVSWKFGAVSCGTPLVTQGNPHQPNLPFRNLTHSPEWLETRYTSWNPSEMFLFCFLCTTFAVSSGRRRTRKEAFSGMKNVIAVFRSWNAWACQVNFSGVAQENCNVCFLGEVALNARNGGSFSKQLSDMAIEYSLEPAPPRLARGRSWLKYFASPKTKLSNRYLRLAIEMMTNHSRISFDDSSNLIF